ncbi:MAG: hypothetical protein WBF71_02945 [Microthrixaceae bacterium]
MSNDFRSDPMDSPEGKGRARRAWDAYVKTANKVAGPVMVPLVAPMARKQVIELVGFWVAWHLYGGFEGLVEQVGMHPSTVWRKVKKFRVAFKEHPDVFEMPGVTIDAKAYWAAIEAKTAEAAEADRNDEG